MALIEDSDPTIVEDRKLAAVLRGLMAKPESRRRVLEAHKVANPDVAIPELDAAKPVMAEIDGVKQMVADFIKESRESASRREESDRTDKLRARWDEGRKGARDQGYTAEGLEQLEKFMQEKGIADHDIAIPAFERIHPPASASAPNGAGQKFDIWQPSGTSKEDIDALLGGKLSDDGFLAKTIPQVLAEIRQK